MLSLAISQYVVGLVVATFVLVSIMMILVVLIQKPQGGGLSGAFGSDSGSGQTAFGAKTGDALTTATILVFLLFIGLSIALNFLVTPPTAPVQQAQAIPAGEATEDDANTPAAPTTTTEIEGNLEEDTSEPVTPDESDAGETEPSEDAPAPNQESGDTP
ncbi:MAG: preprotein translocase subunit SecG [Planctomycetota bacterium]